MVSIFSSPFISGTLHPEWTFLGIELLVYVFVGLCIRDALTARDLAAGDRRRWLALMACAFFFTLAIEMMLSHSLVAGTTPPQRLYTYPSNAFLLQIFDVPAWVPLGWSFILYATMRTTTLLGMKWYLAPLLDGFLALNLDLTLDPIAINRGWWSWNVMANPGDAHLSAYFGIPLVNFMGWYVIVASFSFFTRWLWLKHGRHNPLVLSLGATLLSLPAVAVYQMIANKIMGSSENADSIFANGIFMSTAIWLLCFTLILRAAPNFMRHHAVNRTLVAVPWAFHSYCFALLWITKAKVPPALEEGWLIHQSSELAIFMPIAAVLGIWLYCWPYLDAFSKRSPATNPPASGA